MSNNQKNISIDLTPFLEISNRGYILGFKDSFDLTKYNELYGIYLNNPDTEFIIGNHSTIAIADNSFNMLKVPKTNQYPLFGKIKLHESISKIGMESFLNQTLINEVTFTNPQTKLKFPFAIGMINCKTINVPKNLVYTEYTFCNGRQPITINDSKEPIIIKDDKGNKIGQFKNCFSYSQVKEDEDYDLDGVGIKNFKLKPKEMDGTIIFSPDNLHIPMHQNVDFNLNTSDCAPGTELIFKNINFSHFNCDTELTNVKKITFINCNGVSASHEWNKDIDSHAFTLPRTDDNLFKIDFIHCSNMHPFLRLGKVKQSKYPVNVVDCRNVKIYADEWLWGMTEPENHHYEHMYISQNRTLKTKNK